MSFHGSLLPLEDHEHAAVSAAGLFIAPWHDVEGRLQEFRGLESPFAALISWRNPPGFFDDLAVPQRTDMPHLVLSAWDIEEEEEADAPAIGHVREGLDFARRHEGRLLVNCVAGVSRSTALALGVLCDRLGPGREGEALELLLAVRPQAVPNLLIVRHADALLDRGGRMVEAVLSDPGLLDRREAVGRPRLGAAD
ncbi:MAG: hypothetical protein ACQEUZ_10315 [Pseudomonadota bacterium]